MIPPVARERIRRWLVEPLIAGYGVAGFLAINLMGQDDAGAFGDPDALNTLAYRLALVISFWRAVLGPYFAWWMPDDENRDAE